MAGAFPGRVFTAARLLEEALTTPSCRMSSPEVRDNQRLEFLGDAVLGLIAAEYVFSLSSSLAEGSLTVARAHMVSTGALSAAARRVGIEKLLVRNKGAKEEIGSKALADAVEAVIGAAYLDGGLEAAKEVYASLGLEENAEYDDAAANPKGALQVWAQALRPPMQPVYELVSVQGPSHQPDFTARVSLGAFGCAEGKAGSRKEAEAAAAAGLLARLAGSAASEKEN